LRRGPRFKGVGVGGERERVPGPKGNTRGAVKKKGNKIVGRTRLNKKGGYGPGQIRHQTIWKKQGGWDWVGRVIERVTPPWGKKRSTSSILRLRRHRYHTIRN